MPAMVSKLAAKEIKGLVKEDFNVRSSMLIEQGHRLSSKSKEIKTKGKELVEISRDLRTKEFELINKSGSVQEKLADLLRLSNEIISKGLILKQSIKNNYKRSHLQIAMAGKGLPIDPCSNICNASGESGVSLVEQSILEDTFLEYLKEFFSRHKSLSSRTDSALTTARGLVEPFNLAKNHYQRNVDHYLFWLEKKSKPSDGEELV